MHKVTVRQEIVERVMARRGRYHLFDRLDPKRTALLVIDMQTAFCAPGAPAEVPASRGIVSNINRVTARLRTIGVPVIWVLHATTQQGGRTDWDMFFNNFVASDVRARTVENLVASKQSVWQELDVGAGDRTVFKNRYSALIAGASNLEDVLREQKIDTLLIAGTKTNVCCEATARDAMMLDFNVVMLADCCAALSDDEHRATLETIIQQFGDVRTSDEAVALLSR
jgi:ureidoacrylate peracid hydrolase